MRLSMKTEEKARDDKISKMVDLGIERWSFLFNCIPFKMKYKVKSEREGKSWSIHNELKI